jgi:hypothetical protein
MSDQQFERAVRDWLEDGSDRTPRSAIDGVLLAVRTTRQERDLRIPWRFTRMTTTMRLAAGIAIVAVIGVGALQLLGPGSGIGSKPTPSPTTFVAPTPTALPSAVAPGITGLTVQPFLGPGVDPRDDTIRLTFDLPPAWEQFEDVGALVDGNQPPNGAAVLFFRPNGLFSEPCRPAGDEAAADIPVGSSVDDLVTALVDHPSLDVTAPVNVTLAGYSGKYLDLTIPDDISGCDTYRPLDGHIYAQGPGHRWHMWVIDVGGVRVVVESDDYAGTPAARLAEAQAILDSLEITP